MAKNPPANAGDARNGSSTLGREDPLQQEMAAHSSILAWTIPWRKEPGTREQIHKMHGKLDFVRKVRKVRRMSY